MATQLNGFCADEFRPLQDAFAANFDEHLELGACVAATRNGQSVMDLWAGFADREKTRPWQKDTLVNVFSTTKVMLISCILKLLGEGRIELDAPVASYWPEFAQAGKAGLTVRHVLTHRSGLPGFSEPLPLTALQDWDNIVRILAAQEPWWEPGTQTCYHPYTYGFLLGEVIRRMTGSYASDYFAAEFAQPAGIDFHLGLKDESLRNRVASLQFPADPNPPLEGAGARVWFSVRQEGRDVWNGWEAWDQQRAEVPAANGYGNARSMARMGAILAMNGELDGRRYLTSEVIDQAITEQSYNECPMMGMLRLGLGFGLHSEEFPAPSPTAFHWGGYGGSVLVMDTTTQVSFAYAPNRMVVGDEMHDDARVLRLWLALAEVLASL